MKEVLIQLGSNPPPLSKASNARLLLPIEIVVDGEVLKYLNVPPKDAARLGTLYLKEIYPILRSLSLEEWMEAVQHVHSDWLEEAEDDGKEEPLPRQIISLFTETPGIEIFCGEGDQYYIRHNRRVWGLFDDRTLLLARKLLDKGGKTAEDNTIKIALSTLAARVSESSPKDVHIRIAYHEGAVYVNLGDAEGNIVKITAQGYSILSSFQECPVLFLTQSASEPLPIPSGTGRLEDYVKKHLRPASDRDLRIITGFILGCYNPTGPYPGLVFRGPAESGKTVSERMLVRLIDPNIEELTPTPKDEKDLANMVNNRRIIPLENVSSVQNWLSDALCYVMTGIAFGFRTLYTTTGRTYIKAMMPVVMNGIPNFIRRGDLQSRMLVAELEPIKEFLPQEEVFRRFTDDGPEILGSICTAISKILATPLDDSSTSAIRMADFVKWVERAGLWEPGQFELDCRSNQAEGTEAVVTDSLIGRLLMELIEDEKPRTSFVGTTEEYCEKFREFLKSTDRKIHLKEVESSVRVGNEFSRLSTALEKAGYVFQKKTCRIGGQPVKAWKFDWAEVLGNKVTTLTTEGEEGGSDNQGDNSHAHNSQPLTIPDEKNVVTSSLLQVTTGYYTGED